MEDYRKKIHIVCKKFPTIKLVYLFGSRATGKNGPMSDYDFAVYLTEPDPVKRSDIRAACISELTKKLGTDDVDVAVFNDLESPELKYNIIREGAVLFEREPYRVLIEPQILNEYFDFMYLLRKYHLTTA